MSPSNDSFVVFWPTFVILGLTLLRSVDLHTTVVLLIRLAQ